MNDNKRSADTQFTSKIFHDNVELVLFLSYRRLESQMTLIT